MSPITEIPLENILAEVAQPVLRYLERYVGNRAIAEDLQQETLMRITRGIAAFDGRSSVKTWAFAIANRVAADYFRQPEHRRQIVDLDPLIARVTELPHHPHRQFVLSNKWTVIPRP